MSLSLEDTLTDREIDVLSCILNGRSIKKTALILKISPKTVETYLRNLMIKVQCPSRDTLIDTITQGIELLFFQKRYHLLLGKEDLSLNNKSEEKTIPTRFFPFTTAYVSLALVLCIFFLWCYSGKESQPLKDNFLLPPKSIFLERLSLLQSIDKKFGIANLGSFFELRRGR